MEKSGFIIINKQSGPRSSRYARERASSAYLGGPTSHDVISSLRRITGIKKIGHAGTLDPFASGVLICAIGRDATKRLREFTAMDKEYVADIFLGAKTDTYDRTGLKTEMKLSFGYPKLSFVQDVLVNLTGKQKQLVPAYSATKIGGKKMYELARAGKIVTLPPTEIEIYDIELLKYKWPDLKIKVKCSSGTYIRTLAHDIGQKLGVGAYLKELERTAIGGYNLKQAVSLGKLDKDNWRNHLFNFQK